MLPETEKPIVHGELYARRETENGDIEGYLGTYLQEEFLPGYLAYLAKTFPEKPHYQNLPHVLEQVLTPIIQITAAHDKGVAYGITGIPRYIARGMDASYWDFAAHRLDGGKTWDPDVDVVIKGIPIATLSKGLMDKFGVTETVPDESLPDRVQYVFPLGGFDIHVSVGKIPTVDIQSIIISINDMESGKRLLHADIAELTNDPQVIKREKRVGMTFDWQDLVYIFLTLRHDHIHYRMPKESKDVMFRPNSIVTRSTNEADLLEVVSRAIRMGNMHPLEELVDFGRFAPFFTSDTVLRLQLLILTAMGSRSEALSEYNLILNKDEFKLCFEIDPFWTIACLRDTSIGRLIPGLRHLTPYDWDALMRSDTFAFEATPEGRLVPAEKRNFEYVKRQRTLYRTSLDRQGNKRTDGFVRFLDAMSELELFSFSEVSHDGMFDELWIKRPRAIDIEVGTPEGPIIVPQGQEAMRVGEVYVLSPSEGAPQTQRQAIAKIQRLVESSTPEPPLSVRLDQACHIIRQYARERSTDAMRLKLKNRDYVTSIALTYDILERYHYLTPRLLKQLYDEIELKGVIKRRFKPVLYDLKSLGIIRFYEQQRRHPRGHDETLAFLLLHDQPVHFLRDLVEKKDFVPYIDDIDKKSAIYTVVILTQVLDISTLEALLSLRKRDFEIIRRKMRRSPNIVVSEIEKNINRLRGAYGKYAFETGQFTVVY